MEENRARDGDSELGGHYFTGEDAITKGRARREATREDRAHSG